MGARLKDAVFRFRMISLAEGISYLVLLGVAMPLKYLGDDPRMVQIFGRIHGFLFVIFMIALVQAMSGAGWKLTKAAFAFATSLVPFGAFFLEHRLKNEVTPEKSSG